MGSGQACPSPVFPLLVSVKGCLAALCGGSRLGCWDYIARHESGTQSILGAGWPPVEALGLPIGTQSPPLSDAEVKPKLCVSIPFILVERNRDSCVRKHCFVLRKCLQVQA